MVKSSQLKLYSTTLTNMRVEHHEIPPQCSW